MIEEWISTVGIREQFREETKAAVSYWEESVLIYSCESM